MRLLLVAVLVLSCLAVQAEEALRLDFRSVANWEMRTGWPAHPSKQATAVVTDGVAEFRVAEPNHEMKWVCWPESRVYVETGMWLVIRYRAVNYQPDSDYLLWLGDGSKDGVRAIAGNQIHADGQWHTQALNLLARQVGSPVSSLALQCAATAAGNASLAVEYISFTDTPPGDAEGYVPESTAERAWREITLPPTRRGPAEARYQLVTLLDPLDDPARWVPETGDGLAKTAVTTGAGRLPGQKALQVAYGFTGVKAWERVGLGSHVPLACEAGAVGLWMKGDQQALPVRICLMDASGESFQFVLGRLECGKWTLAVTEPRNGDHWGGDNNGTMDPPLHIAWILMGDEPVGTGHPFEGQATLSQLGVYRQIPGRLWPHGFKVSVPREQRLMVYDPGQPVRLRVAADVNDKTLPPLPLDLRVRLVDPFGTVTSESSLKLVDGGQALLDLTPDSVGAYDVQLRLAGREDDLDAPWADVRLAVLPPPAGEPASSPFGVCTHFDYAMNPKRVMPAIARAGIKWYRDDMSWSLVEREKGKLTIPQRWLTFLDLGQKLGLEPLIVTAYTNSLYEAQADFPIHPESREAFARYVGFLARECPQVHSFEVWNEWCGGCNMTGHGHPEDYPPLFLDTARALRKSSPTATIVGIGGEPKGDAFAAMMAGGAGAQMDAASIHPYGVDGSRLGQVLYKSAAQARAGAGKPVPLWITEFGWPTATETNPFGRGATFLQEASRLVRTIVIALASGVQRVFWYDFTDDSCDLTNYFDNAGLVHNDAYGLAPKPAYVAYAHLINALHGRTLSASGMAGEGLWHATFRGDKDQVTVLWADQAEGALPFSLPPTVRVEDMFGRPIRAGATLTVTQDPVFIVGPR